MDKFFPRGSWRPERCVRYGSTDCIQSVLWIFFPWERLKCLMVPERRDRPDHRVDGPQAEQQIVVGSGVVNMIVLSWRDMDVSLSRSGGQRAVGGGDGAQDASCGDRLDCVESCDALLPGEDRGVSEVTRVRSLVAMDWGMLFLVLNLVCH